MNKPKAYLGLDIGTSNLVLAYIKEHSTEVQVPRMDAIGDDNLVPSYVCWENGKFAFAGKDARKEWLKGLKTDSKKKYYRHFKMNIGSATVENEPSTQELMSNLIKASIDALIGNPLHKPIDIDGFLEVVATVPHSWTDAQRRATQEAVENVGIKVASLISEPIAAAANYAWVNHETSEFIALVCDMGGGTFDVSLVHIYPNQSIEELTVSRTNDLAGNMADALIALSILSKFSNVDFARLPESKKIEEARKLLKREETEVSIRELLSAVSRARQEMNTEYVRYGIAENEGREIIFSFDDKPQSYKLSYVGMTMAYQLVCDRAKLLIKLVLDEYVSKYNLNFQNLRVVLAGGMTRMDTVQRSIADAANKEVTELTIFTNDTDTAIARGAALVAAGVVAVYERLSYTVGMYVKVGRSDKTDFVPILESGLKVPCSIETTNKYYPERDNIAKLVLRIVMRDENNVEENFSLTFTPFLGRLRETDELRFRFEIGKSLTLSVTPELNGRWLTPQEYDISNILRRGGTVRS